MNHLSNDKPGQPTDPSADSSFDSSFNSSSESSFPLDIEQLLDQGNIIRIKPQGTSMHPLFISGRDEACIERADFSSLKRGDVALYRRNNSILVLHRIWKITADSFYMVGDNQTEIEGPLRPDQIRGKLVGIIRNGHFIDVHNPLYRLLSNLWLHFRPLRPVAWKIMSLLRKITP